MTAEDLVITTLADDLATCTARLDAMTDLAAGLAIELYAVRWEFLRIIKFVDNARVAAQRERDAMLTLNEDEAAA